MKTVRDSVLEVLRRLEMTTIFSNPGSTEIPFLVDLPEDFRFVLALHEGSVVSVATGYVLMQNRPALVLLHTTAGLGNAVSALATARVNRAPLVVLVGQQDRRHLAQAPFLAGRLTGLGGEYPLAVHDPVRAQDVPGTIVQAREEAITGRGPVLVVVPMDDWQAPAPEPHEIFGPGTVRRPPAVDDQSVGEVAARLASAAHPAIVAGAGADGADPAAWAALTEVAERLQAPVWQEAFSARAGFPQDHSLFAGQLPAERTALRAALAGHDTVLTVGAGTYRQYPYSGGPLVASGTAVLLVSADPDEVHRSVAELAVLADPNAFMTALAPRLDQRPHRPEPMLAPVPPPPPAPPLRAGHVLSVLSELITPETVFFEEAPSNKSELHRRLRARRPASFMTPAMGGLGFSLPAAVGVRMGAPDRGVLAILGDGSSLYGIQGLWTAVKYDVGVLFVVLANGGYAIMDKLARRAGGSAPWPQLDGVSVAAIARGFGCTAITVDSEAALRRSAEEILPALAARSTPLVLEVIVAPDESNDL